MRDPAPMITEAHDHVRALYGSAIGKSKYDVVTPALVIDKGVVFEGSCKMENLGKGATVTPLKSEDKEAKK